MQNVSDIYALTPLQQLMLAQARVARDQGLLVEQFRCTLSGGLDARRLQAAAQAVAARHALLRASFAWEGLKRPVQVVRQRVELPWIGLDWRQSPAAEKASRFEALLDEDRRRGFDLTQAPLHRFHLVQIADRRWQLLWTCHHLILDGWSAAIVLQELFRRYDQPAGTAVEGNPGSFADYLGWLKQRDAGEADRFWQRMLRGAPAAAGLPIELPIELPHAEQEEPAPAFGQRELRLDALATSRLNQLAGQLRTSLSAMVQAAWAVLLAHYNAAAEVIFGVAVSGRPPQAKGVETIVGPLMNNIPVRIAVDWDTTLPELLGQLQSIAAEAQPFEYSTQEQIARAAGLGGQRPLFDTLVVFENYPLANGDRWRSGDVEISDVSGTASSNHALSLIAIPGRQLALRLLYDRQAYADETAEALLRQAATLLGEMADKPLARLRELALIESNAQGGSWPSAAADDDFRVLDAAGRWAPPGMTGPIWIVAEPGERRSTDDTAMDRRPDPLDPSGGVLLRNTGYRGARQPDGTIRWLGRQADQVRVNNVAVNPPELSAILTLHPLVEQGVVIPRSDCQGRPQLAAFVVPSADARSAVDSGRHGLLLEQLCQFMGDRMPSELVPRIWRTLPALPLTADGRVDADKLPEAFRPRGETSQPYVAPRDVLEARLCGIWSEVLGVEPIGVDDDFVDLGGHSSLAVAMATRLEREFARRLSLAALLEKPTVAHLACLLRQRLPAADENVLAPIRSHGSKRPLFCVHPAGGTVMCYLELARHLDADLPIYGLQAQGIDGDLAPLETVAEMAACYVRAMKRVQPTGPYQLCGWSTGGVIAFEMAGQLEAAGDDVSLLALLDAAIPRAGENFDEKDIAMLLGMLFPGENLAELQERTGDEQLEAFRHRAERAALLAAGAPAGQAARIYSVFQANMQAVAEYRPGAYQQPLTIIRAAQQATPMHADPLLGWGACASGDVEVRAVDCSHLDMLQQPAVQAVAQALAEAMSASEAVAPA